MKSGAKLLRSSDFTSPSGMLLQPRNCAAPGGPNEANQPQGHARNGRRDGGHAGSGEGCQVGPPQHHKRPLVFMDYDQLELDASYDQIYYEPLIAQMSQRLASNSNAMRARIGAPQRVAYGPTEIEKLDIYRTSAANAPIFVFIHGGNWRSGAAKDYGFPAEMFVNAGAHYVALDFIAIKEAGGDLGVMAAQVRRGIAWVYKNAATFGRRCRPTLYR